MTGELSPSLEMVGETDLHRKVRFEKLPLYFDCIDPGDAFIDLQTVRQILGDEKLTESCPPVSRDGRLEYVWTPRAYPGIAAVIEPGRLTVRTYSEGMTCGQVIEELDLPPEMTCLFLKTVQTSQSVGTIIPETIRDIDFSKTTSYLGVDSTMPNIATGYITAVVVVPRAPAYYFCRNNSRSYSARRIGPSHLLVPFSPNIKDMEKYVATYLSTFTEHPNNPDLLHIQSYGMNETPTSRVCKRGACSVGLVGGNKVKPESLAFEVFPGALPSNILGIVSEHARNVSLLESRRFDFDKGFSAFIQRSSAESDDPVYKLWVDRETGAMSLGVFVRGLENAHVCKFAFYPNRPDLLPATAKNMYDVEMCILEKSFTSLFGQLHMTPAGIGEIMNTMANSEAMFHLRSHTSYASMVEESTNIVNNMDWLYEFQKETVRNMILHETCADGTASLYGSRVSGEAFSHGVFLREDDAVCKYVPPSLCSDLRKTMGFLADQPGMGKTRQCVALVQATNNRATSATLVIVQPSIIQQWKAEIQSVWPGADVYMYYGQRKSISGLDNAFINSDIVLTTASTLTSNIGHFAHKSWFRVMVDESHTIPNLMVSGVQLGVQHKWCVTGTPDVNLARQLHWLFQESLWMVRIMAGRHITPSDIACPKYLWRTLRPILFRKTRDLHLCLPEVREHTVTVDLTTQERSRYTELASSYRTSHPYGVHRMTDATRLFNVLQGVSTMGLSADKILNTGGGESTKSIIFSTTDYIESDAVPDDVCPICLDAYEDVCRTACNHHFCAECLSIHAGNGASCPMCRRTIIARSVLKCPPPAEAMEMDEDTIVPSTKAIRMVEEISRVLESDQRSKVLVFFPHAYMLTWFKEILSQSNIDCLTVSGTDSVTKRTRNFSLFQTSRGTNRVMLMTIRCASAGITLTEADHVMLATPCMKKSLEEQLIGRANRIGRGDRPVHFHRFVSENTVEDLLIRQYTESESGGIHARVVNSALRSNYMMY